MGLNTAPLNERKDLGLDKTKDKNREKVESSGEEDEDGPLDELNSKNKTKSTDEQQTDFKTGPEKATNMKANMVPPSVGVSGLQNHVERFHVIGVVESKRTEELENQASGLEERLEDDETEEDDTKKSKQEIVIWRRRMMIRM